MLVIKMLLLRSSFIFEAYYPSHDKGRIGSSYIKTIEFTKVYSRNSTAAAAARLVERETRLPVTPFALFCWYQTRPHLGTTKNISF